ncbi:MAG: hypothetical protein GY733_01120 [bacterium]|nr:hypothetical protein [bacterium]
MPSQRPSLELVLLPSETSAALRPLFFGVGDAPEPGPLTWAVVLTSHTTTYYGEYDNGEEARAALLTAHFYSSPDGAYLGTRKARGNPPWLHGVRTVKGEWVHPDVKSIAHGELVAWLCAEHGYAPREKYERLLLEAVSESTATR